MAFESFADFINMGGYGFFVWLSYAFCAVTLSVLTINSLGLQQAQFKKINNRLKREAKLKQAAQRRIKGE
ncbi:heme exporter protein CcmD [Thalassotalea maritima]|uniref:heme exporter protein CcmD n=1 Tax=Thalassotalea maritima TaxID=3242416 RepID=UPI00352913F6